MSPTTRIGLSLVALLALLGGLLLFFQREDASGTALEPSVESPELVGGFGDLSGGGGSSGGASGSRGGGAVLVGALVDAGVRPSDAGEAAPLGQAVVTRPLDPPGSVAPSVTFPAPRTVEDEYDSATMIWSMVEARREAVRAELAEARRTGDQELSARLTRQLALLEIGDHRLAGIVRDLEGQRGTPASTETVDTAHADGAEGASDPTPAPLLAPPHP